MAVIVFRAGVETSLRDGLGTRLTERLRARMAEAGVDFSRPLLPGYSPEVFRRCIELAREEAFADRPLEEVQTELAEAGFRAFTSGFVGQAMGGVMRAVGAKRTLQRLDRFLKNGQSEMRLGFVDVAPTECEVTLEPVLGMPHYYRGMILAGGRLLALSALEVSVVRVDGDAATYRVRWAA
jgi:uncharacterized protein (TIGR02265 family)